jgi:hypothetical protein
MTIFDMEAVRYLFQQTLLHSEMVGYWAVVIGRRV